MIMKKLLSCQKAQNVVYFGPYDFVQISLAYGANIFKECMERLYISNVSIIAWKSFNGKFTAKIDLPIGNFMLPLLMLTLEV